jgi:ribonuclease HI
MPSALMRDDEFVRALRQLSPDLQERACTIRSGTSRAGRCPYCRIAERSLDFALRAATFDQHDWAGVLLAEAEHYAGLGCHPLGCSRHTGPRPGRRPPGVHGHIRRWAGTRPVIAATDASWKKGHGGLGYVTSTGQWGFRSRPEDRTDPSGRSKVLVNELRAVELLLSVARDDVSELVLLMDSQRALTYLRSWQSGRTDLMPDGYDLRPRRQGVPTLVRLAERVAALPGLCLEHVKAHSGHPLNEAADSLASIARRSLTESFDAATRAEDLAKSFLLTWHQTALAA